MTNEKFEIFKGKDQQFYFRLKASNGEIIGKTEGYTTKQSAETGIASVKVNSRYRNSFELKESSNDQWYFNLKAQNSEIILTSETYVSKQGAENGIESVMNNAPDAKVIDLTQSQAA